VATLSDHTMTFRDWVVETRTHVRELGYRRGVAESAYEFYLGAWRRAGRAIRRGDHVYDREWDVLLVLDACRLDLMQDVEEEWVRPIDSIWSVGSSSPEWLEKTFDDVHQKEMAETVYVTGNPFSEPKVEAEWFEELDEVWRYGWDDSIGTIPPAHLSGRVMAHHDREPEHMIVHYMQPHYPFVPDPIGDRLRIENFGDMGTNVWDMLRRGQVTREAVWSSYRKNLEYVLEDVERLLGALDDETVVVTADHGNGLGEWGIYGHPLYVQTPELRRVPWIELDAGEFDGSYDALSVDDVRERSTVELADTEKLEHLGYV
jgi:hypothetical protein